MEPSLFIFDPQTVTAEELAERFPDIGLFVAEDIIDSRRKNDGAFPDEAALVALGLTAELAQQITAAAASPANEVTAAAASPANEVTAAAASPVAEVTAAAAVADEEEPAAEERATAAPAPRSERPAPVVSPLPAFALPGSEPPAPEVIHVAPKPERTLFDVAAAAADVVDESEIEDAPESRPAKTPAPPAPAPAPVVVVAAAPVSAPPAPESAPPVAHAESAPPAEPLPAPKRAKRAGLVAMLVTVNLAAIAGVAAGYQQERGTRKEVVTISSDVGAMKVEQAAAKERSEEAMTKLEETRTRLEEQEKLLAQTKARVAAAEARLAEDERAAHEHETKEAQESAVMNSRVIRVEDKTMKLDEALKQLEAFDR